MKQVKKIVIFVVLCFSFLFVNMTYANDLIDYESVSINMKEVKSGLYKGSALGENGRINVYVRVSNHEIKQVLISSHREHIYENSQIHEAIKRIPEEMIETNRVEVPVVVGAKVTSNGIINAVKNALTAVKFENGNQVIKTADPLKGLDLLPEWKRPKELTGGTSYLNRLANLTLSGNVTAEQVENAILSANCDVNFVNALTIIDLTSASLDLNSFEHDITFASLSYAGELTINAINSHVVINGGTIDSLISYTSPTTLELSKVNINTKLTLMKGSLESRESTLKQIDISETNNTVTEVIINKGSVEKLEANSQNIIDFKFINAIVSNTAIYNGDINLLLEDGAEGNIVLDESATTASVNLKATGAATVGNLTISGGTLKDVIIDDARSTISLSSNAIVASNTSVIAKGNCKVSVNSCLSSGNVLKVCAQSTNENTEVKTTGAKVDLIDNDLEHSTSIPTNAIFVGDLGTTTHHLYDEVVYDLNDTESTYTNMSEAMTRLATDSNIDTLIVAKNFKDYDVVLSSDIEQDITIKGFGNGGFRSLAGVLGANVTLDNIVLNGTAGKAIAFNPGAIGAYDLTIENCTINLKKANVEETNPCGIWIKSNSDDTGDINISNNKIVNSKWNLINIYGELNTNYKGSIVIDNNCFANWGTSDTVYGRAIRLVTEGVTITNNRFNIREGLPRESFIKVSNVNDYSKIHLSNNDYSEYDPYSLLAYQDDNLMFLVQIYNTDKLKVYDKNGNIIDLVIPDYIKTAIDLLTENTADVDVINNAISLKDNTALLADIDIADYQILINGYSINFGDYTVKSSISNLKIGQEAIATITVDEQTKYVYGDYEVVKDLDNVTSINMDGHNYLASLTLPENIALASTILKNEALAINGKYYLVSQAAKTLQEAISETNINTVYVVNDMSILRDGDESRLAEVVIDKDMQIIGYGSDRIEITTDDTHNAIASVAGSDITLKNLDFVGVKRMLMVYPVAEGGLDYTNSMDNLRVNIENCKVTADNYGIWIVNSYGETEYADMEHASANNINVNIKDSEIIAWSPVYIYSREIEQTKFTNLVVNVSNSTLSGTGKDGSTNDFANFVLEGVNHATCNFSNNSQIISNSDNSNENLFMFHPYRAGANNCVINIDRTSKLKVYKNALGTTDSAIHFGNTDNSGNKVVVSNLNNVVYDDEGVEKPLILLVRNGNELIATASNLADIFALDADNGINMYYRTSHETSSFTEYVESAYQNNDKLVLNADIKLTSDVYLKRNVLVRDATNTVTGMTNEYVDLGIDLNGHSIDFNGYSIISDESSLNLGQNVVQYDAETEVYSYTDDLLVAMAKNDAANDEVTLAKDYTFTEAYAPAETFTGILNGNNHTVSGMENTNSYCSLINIVNGKTLIKNIKFEPVVSKANTEGLVPLITFAKDTVSTETRADDKVYKLNVSSSDSSIEFNNVTILAGEIKTGVNDANEAPFICAVDSDIIKFINCTNNLSYTNYSTSYNSFFIGYVQSIHTNKYNIETNVTIETTAYFDRTVEFTNCVNNGNLIEPKAGLFYANGFAMGSDETEGKVTTTITNCVNNGYIKGTEAAGYVAASDLTKLNDYDQEIVGLDKIILLPKGNLAISLGEDGIIDITRYSSDDETDYQYIVNYSAYATIDIGTMYVNLDFDISEKVANTGLKDYDLILNNDYDTEEWLPFSNNSSGMFYVIDDVNNIIYVRNENMFDEDYYTGFALNSETPTIIVNCIDESGNLLTTAKLSR